MPNPAGTYTYSGDPNSSPKDTVRFLANATGEDKATGIASDEEIQWILNKQPNIYLAAAMVADRGASYWGSQRSKTVGPLTISGRDAATAYVLLAAELRNQSSQGGNGDSSGGPISLGNDTVLFAVGMTDYCGGGYYGYDQSYNSLLGGTP